MLNQTFSITNFEEIYDEDNRKGKNQDAIFFPEVTASSKRLSAKARALRAFKKRYSFYSKYPKNVQRKYDTLYKNIRRQKEDRERKVLKALTAVSQNINKRSFRVKIVQNNAHAKPLYENDGSPESYYALRQISRNIRRLYKTKPADRNQIISQVQNLLEDDFPYIIIRSDIKSFFESVDQKSLIEKLIKDQLLSTSSIKIIKQILWDYSALTKSKGIGIPRGLGISSDLAELYLKGVDQEIKEIEDVVYYARYVDDIFILIAPNSTTDPSTYLPQIQEAIHKRMLSVNEDKTIQLVRGDYQKSFEYLGYEFTLKKNTADIDITKSKFEKIKLRVLKSFESYEKQRHRNSKAAYRLLLKRIKFLTSNTRLVNSKANAFVGIFFSNPNLTSYKRLEALDAILKDKSDKIISTSLKSKLKRLSFRMGHEEKTYEKFNRRRHPHKKDEFSQIVRAWRHEKYM